MRNKIYQFLFFLCLASFVPLAVLSQTPTFVGNSGYPFGNVSGAGIAYGNSKYVNVASNGMIYTSTDGESWLFSANLAPTATPAPTINKIKFGNSTFVVVGLNGYISSSTDGINWTTRTSGTTKTLGELEFIQGKFFAVGPDRTLLTSVDGITWSSVVLNGGASNDLLMNITYGNGKYIIGFRRPGFADNYIYKSSTGLSNEWTVQSVGMGGINRVYYLKDRFWMFVSNTKIFTSTDGDVWSEITSSTVNLPNGATTVLGSPNQMFRGIFDGSNLYFFGSSGYDGGHGSIIKSPDGTTFTLLPKTAYINNSGADYLNGKYFQWGGEGFVSSTDGSNYKYSGGNYSGLASSGTNYVAVGAVGTGGIIFKSDDFSTFTNVTPSGQRALYSVVYGGSKYLAVGDRTVMESTDGNTWVSVAPSTSHFTSVTYGASKYVAVGYDVSTSAPKIAYSSTGGGWTTANSDNNYYYKIKYVNNKFFALGSDNSTYRGVIYTSADGISWSDITPDLADEVYYYNDVVWDGAKYHFMGMEYIGDPANFSTSFFTVSTSDPTSTTSFSGKAVITNQPAGVTLGGTFGEGAFEFVNGQLAGVISDISNYRAYVIYSSTGSSWTAIPTELYSGFYGSIKEPNRIRFAGSGDTKLTVQIGASSTSPAITSATYNAATGVLLVSGTDLQANGSGNDIDVLQLTLTGEGGTTYTLSTSDVEISSSTSFSLTLNATDKSSINQILNKNGTVSTGSTTYNLAAAAGWMTTVSGSTDLAGNGITVSNVAVPTITSATYNASTGSLVVMGTGFLSASGADNDLVASKFTLSGEGGSTYTLTDSANPEITSGTSFTVTLSTADKAAVNLVLNKNGTSSTGGTTYNLAATEDWAAGADAAVIVADATGNGIIVSNVAAPTITSATYNASTGALVVTGTGFLTAAGATNDIQANKFTFTGEGGGTYTLTDTENNEITSGTLFTLTLSATDKAAINTIINKNGTSAQDVTTYNLAAAEDWASGADATVIVADLTGNSITTSNVDNTSPTVTSVASSTPNGTYKVGDAINIQVNFSETITVAGTPQLTLETGTTDRVINYVSGSGSTTLTFNYTVQSGDSSADLDYANTGAFTLNDGTIRDITGNNAVLTLPVAGGASSLGGNNAILVDGIAPAVASVSSGTSNGSYKIGDLISIQVNFNEAVTVSGTPQLTLETGTTDRLINYAAGSGTSSVTFNYTVQSGDVNTDLDYASTTALAFNGGTVKDAAGNNAMLALTNPGSPNSLGANKAILIDGVAPDSPPGLVATSGNTQITLSWIGSEENDLASYKLFGGTTSNPTTLLQAITTPTVTYTHTGLTNGISYYYRIAAVDMVGNESPVSSDVTAVPKSTQTITFNALAIKAYGDADFDPGATSSSGLAVSYSSSNTSVATIVSNKIHIMGTGTATITASQSGNGGYLAATDATQTLTVNKKNITLTLNATPAITKVYNGTNGATLTPANYNLSGLQTGDAVTVSGTAVYSDKNAGTRKTITASSFVLAGTGKDNYNLTTTAATTTGDITKKDIIVSLNASPAITKAYDAATRATLASGNYTLNAVESGDVVTVSGTANYTDKNVGTGKTITVNSLVLAGPQEGNYNLATSTATTTGDITKKDITLSLNASPAISKVYDGSALANLASRNYTMAGIESGDEVTVSGTAVFDDKNTGLNKTITVNSFVLAGAQKDNYNLTTASALTTGEITKKDITLSLIATPAITKVYDGGTSATLAAGNYSLSGIEAGDLVSASGPATYADKSVGTGKTITVMGFTLAGAEKDNYNLTTTSANTTGNITRKDITLTLNASPAITKTYDASAVATLIAANYTLSGIETGDMVTVSGTATYIDKNVGALKMIGVSSFVLAGAQKENYNLTTTTASITGAIVAKDITLTLNATPLIKKVYNGTVLATLASDNYTLSGLESGDAVRVNGTAAYTDKNAGTGKTIMASGFVLAGTDKDNYNLTTATATTTGDITKKDITVSLNASPAITKVYDGSASADLGSGNYSLPGIESGDKVSVSGTAVFDNKNAGTNKTITINRFVLSGAQKDNYSLTTNSAATTGAITQKNISVSLKTSPAITKVYDGSAAASLVSGNYNLAGVENGDEVTVSGTAVFDNKNTGTNKTIMVNSFVLAGAQKDNYSLTTTSALTTGGITKKGVTLILNATPLITKTYDGTTSIALASGNYNLQGLESGDQVTVSGTAVFDNKNSAASKMVTVNDFTLFGLQKGNYNLTTSVATTSGEITQRNLTATADDKEKFLGTANPPFTVSYSGFIAGEDETVLTTRPEAVTTAATASGPGSYPVTPGGGEAENYSFRYVPGILTIKPGAPTSIALASQTVFEKAAAGTLAGKLSSTSDDPNSTFTYTLVSGAGSVDNGLFTISGSEIRAQASLNYEEKASYEIRVRSTTQYGFSLEREFIININDVNEIPTLDAIADQTICYTNSQQTIALSGITAGEDRNQAVNLAVSSTNKNLFSQLAVSGNELRYKVSGGQSGTALVTVRVTDNGGIANGGINTFSRTFTITVNPLPVITITSDRGTDLSKGLEATLEATGGMNYQWSNAHGIIGGQNAATLRVRPAQTTTYRVKVINNNGCSTEQEIIIKVSDNYMVLEANNIMSPDGDGVNDKFKIGNIDMYPNNIVKIYDRAGRLLYSKKNYTNDWDGTFQGSPLAEDTYFYIVDFGIGIRPIKGFVTIVRE